MSKLRLLLLLFLFCTPLHGGGHYLTICAIFQNEAQWLKEWIEYHLLVGVDSFLLYENNSSDGWQAVLQPYIDKGVVEIVDWSSREGGFPKQQADAYNDGLQRLKQKSEWVAFIDTDEFICPIENDSVADFLRAYEEFGGVVLNWRLYGTSGVNSLQGDDLLIEKLIKTVDESGREAEVIKSIVRPCHTTCTNGVHRFLYRRGYYAVNTNFVPSHPRWWRRFTHSVHFDRCVINHYRFRTLDWAFGEKLSRNMRYYNTTFDEERRRIRTQDASTSKVRSSDMERFVSPLKARMRCSN